MFAPASGLFPGASTERERERVRDREREREREGERERVYPMLSPSG